MVGRVEVEEGPRDLGQLGTDVLEQDALAGTERVGVGRHGQHVGMAADGPEAALVVPHERRLVAQPGEEGVGVAGVERRVGERLRELGGDRSWHSGHPGRVQSGGGRATRL